MSESLTVAVCGTGAWGTAMAIYLAKAGCDTRLIARRAELATQLNEYRENKDYLAGYLLPENLVATDSIVEGLAGAEIVFMGAPSYALRGWMERIEAEVDDGVKRLYISLAKGLDQETGQTPCEIMKEARPHDFVACLSGPTFAAEVAEGKPTAMTLAAEECGDLAERIQCAASGPGMRIYLSDDLKGVELGGCLKNVYAIASGCCQGLELGDNALAALLTRSLTEMVRVGQSLGAKVETFYGLSGFGDMVATCHGDWSRNRTFGEEIAKSDRTAAEIVASQKTAVEGYRTAKAFFNECAAKGIDAPILRQVYRILYEGKRPIEALTTLMSRDLKKEWG
ncbi:MAG: NAD(P)H-dependent glycerol-3-phosphate dehydrogenase [Verrucomicrobiota bacterium]